MTALDRYQTFLAAKVSFTVASFDEADALRSFGSKTFSEVVVTGGWNEIPFRYVASATPDPNDYIELLGYAQFLGVMERGWRHVVGLLLAHGAPVPEAGSDLRVWLGRALASTTRTLRHPGNHRYAWALQRSARRFVEAGSAYPKAVAA